MNSRGGVPSIFALCGLSVLWTGLALGIALVLRQLLQPDVPGQVSSPLLLGAVVVSTWYGGMTAGLLSTLISLVSLKLLFIPPLFSLDFGWEEAPRLTVFLIVSLIVSRLNAKRHDAERMLEATQEQMRIARSIQQKLFPVAPPDSSYLEVAGTSQPADATGGDYYDYIPMRGGCIGIVVGDVSGHGFGSALLMAATRAYLHALTLSHDDPGELLTKLNRLLAHDTDDERFLTLFFVRLDPQRRSFTYAGAGHEGFQIDSMGQVMRLRSTGPPLGIEGDTVIHRSGAIPLPTGDVLVSVTDGFFEAEMDDGSQFGISRLLDVVGANRARNAHDILETLLTVVGHCSRTVKHHDDLTAVVVKGNG